MDSAKVVPINDAAVQRTREQIAANLTTIERYLRQEVERINADMKALREDVERLKQGGGTPTSA